MKNYKDNLKNGEKKVKGFFGEFKTFIQRGNVIDLAVGVVIGGEFGIKDEIYYYSPYLKCGAYKTKGYIKNLDK